MKFKEGEYVRIISRETTPVDVKDGSFYPYFCGLEGTVDRMYGDEICINVDLETLPKDVLKRHLDIQESIKRKWLNNLSAEARNKLTPEEKRFDLAYTILVRSADIEKAKPGQPKPVSVKSVQPLSTPAETPAPKKETAPAEEKPKASRPAAKSLTEAKAATVAPKTPPAPKKPETGESHALTIADINAAEMEFLKERKKALKSN